MNMPFPRWPKRMWKFVWLGSTATLRVYLAKLPSYAAGNRNRTVFFKKSPPTVLQAEHEAPERFREVFAKTIDRLKMISQDEGVRWYDLMRIVFTWIAWRRPKDEYPELLLLMKQDMPSAKHQEEFDQMIANHLGPSLTDLARQEGREEGRELGQIEAGQNHHFASAESEIWFNPQRTPAAHRCDHRPCSVRENVYHSLRLQNVG